MTKTVCTIRIEMSAEDEYRQETTVKDVWPRMVPWFTQRHGIREGKIEINGGDSVIHWIYEDYEAADEPPEA